MISDEEDLFLDEEVARTRVPLTAEARKLRSAANADVRRLGNHVLGYGNSFDYFNLVAVRFQKPVVWTNRLASSDKLFFFEETKTSLIVCKRLACLAAPSQTKSNTLRRERKKLEKELLLRVLKGDGKNVARSVLLHSFRDGVLYALTCGPFPRKFRKVRRNVAFRTAMEILLSCAHGTIDSHACEKLRFLKRNRPAFVGNGEATGTPAAGFWHSFYHLASAALSPLLAEQFGLRSASAQFAALLRRARRRTEQLTARAAAGSPLLLPPSVPPEEFYCCEITFESDELLGIAYTVTLVSRFTAVRETEVFDKRIEYVSPMIVRHFPEGFNDNCSRRVNAWLPLYRNHQWWEEKGFPYFKNKLADNVRELRAVAVWVSGQTSEKYKCILADLDVLLNIFR